MQRSDALAPLSRDHHQALAAALVLRRASDETVRAAAERFLAFWTEHGRRHFEIEEELILGALPGEDGWAEACARVRAEHAEVRAAAEALGRAPDAAAANALGELLAAHVRFEERELFAMLEDRLGAPELAELGRAVQAAEEQPAG